MLSQQVRFFLLPFLIVGQSIYDLPPDVINERESAANKLRDDPRKAFADVRMLDAHGNYKGGFVNSKNPLFPEICTGGV